MKGENEKLRKNETELNKTIDNIKNENESLKTQIENLKKQQGNNNNSNNKNNKNVGNNNNKNNNNNDQSQEEIDRLKAELEQMKAAMNVGSNASSRQCAKCQKAITERALKTSDGKLYHRGCYVCDECGAMLAGKQYGILKGNDGTEQRLCADCVNKHNTQQLR